MRLSRVFTIGLLSTLICMAAVPVAFAQSQSDASMFAIQRGYRTGYSDGYMAGYRDSIDSIARNYSRHAEYSKADRAYSKDYGTIADYRDGYQQGFENGYDTGFDRRSFEASLPTGLERRGVVVGDRKEMVAQTTQPKASTSTETVRIEQRDTSQSSETESDPAYQNRSAATIVIPRDTELVVELDTDLNTQSAKEGDKFTARIVAPGEITGASVEGRVTKVKSPGRLKRRSEMVLSFDRIVLADSRWSNFAATLTEVMPVKGDAIKVGGATGIGAVTGAVIGGPVGAAVGAGVGAAFGVGAVVIQRGKHIRLNRNQQMRIRTSYETQIR